MLKKQLRVLGLVSTIRNLLQTNGGETFEEKHHIINQVYIV